jgi:hypothetical protein
MIGIAIDMQRRNAGQKRGKIRREQLAGFQQLAAQPFAAVDALSY